jgi:hypothetical protein
VGNGRGTASREETDRHERIGTPMPSRTAETSTASGHQFRAESSKDQQHRDTHSEQNRRSIKRIDTPEM